MKYSGISLIIFLLLSCQQQIPMEIKEWKNYDESLILKENEDHSNARMRYKLIQSKFQDKNEIWKKISLQLHSFDEENYEDLTPLIFEQDIPTIQSNIKNGLLSYENLVKWFLYRIVQNENDSLLTLHTIIDINKDAVRRARICDKTKSDSDHPIFGMPILLKDNINTLGMRTTAGAHALSKNFTKDAKIVERLKSNGAIILGKVNLSEWAYYFCGGCPVGYSAMGGQTLNPYGRYQFETGGSSSGSGTSIAANYAVAAVGTETSGSILSPSSQNSVVGLKPTIGLLSRSGIVPISSTLDTPGPMTKNVIDNAILLSAMEGKDPEDPYTEKAPSPRKYLKDLGKLNLSTIKLGAFRSLVEQDSLYKTAISDLENAGAEVILFDNPSFSYEGFLTLLNIDMKNDLPNYLENYAGQEVEIKTVNDVINYNMNDSINYMPYDQARLDGIISDSTSTSDFEILKSKLMEDGRKYFENVLQENNLSAILSINNYHAGQAAVAHYPCLTVPMGYRDSGEPANLTFIAPSWSEDLLLNIALGYEQNSRRRIPPKNYN